MNHPELLAVPAMMLTDYWLTLFLKMSKFTYIGVLPLMFILVANVRDSLAVGLLLGSISLVLAHSVWEAKLRPQDLHV